ncbi:Protein rhsA [Salmonella enterica subsp. salamae]|nr:Protein rhsA [Salmonella enterica subsp. salamae]
MHHYSYDQQHRLVSYQCTEGYSSRSITESRYVYDAAERRVCKQVWRRERYGTGRHHDYTALPEKPEVTWYGWDGDRLVTAQTEQSRIQTIYEPGGFTPLVRVETGTEALATTRPQRSLAEKLRQEGNEDGTEMAFPAELVHRLDRLENELRCNAVSEESRKWLAQCGLTAEQMAGQLDAQTEPERTVHLYHCDHRGLPVALINSEGVRDWSAEYDVWGNRLKEDNPQKLAQLIRLPGQQYDDETGLYYNRYRYYNPEQGRYISQDPIGLHGGLNPYTYPLNPVTEIDPLGLWAFAIPAIIEGINWLFWGSTVTGGAVLATSGDSEKSKNKTESLTNCPTMPPNDPCDKKLDKGLLQKAGIEKMEHSIKIESVGRNNISKFDLCGCNNGKIVIKEHGCKGKSIVDETEYTWK